MTKDDGPKVLRFGGSDNGWDTLRPRLKGGSVLGGPGIAETASALARVLSGIRSSSSHLTDGQKVELDAHIDALSNEPTAAAVAEARAFKDRLSKT